MPSLSLSKFRLTPLVIGLASLCLILLLRFTSLEVLDFSDPTESRYAYIAQRMVTSGDWVTPKLPYPEGLVSYLGKPPLHFWLTASSISIFGMDEWSARLPSFAALLVIVLALIWVGREIFNLRDGIQSATIAAASVILFYFSGSVVVDVTLAAAVTAALAGYAVRLLGGKSAVTADLILTLGLAAGFLTKGPVAIVLVLAPIFLFHLIARELPKISAVRLGLIVFGAGALVVPWFIFAERSNPGFITYFFWNENVLRFLVKDYGDRFGSGHVHHRGASWWMAMLAFLPWTPLLLLRISTVAAFRSSRKELYVIVWALFPPLFFTFARQLHIGYLLPALPGLAILLMLALREVPISRIERKILLPLMITLMLVGASGAAIHAGYDSEFFYLGAIALVAVAVVAVVMRSSLRDPITVGALCFATALTGTQFALKDLISEQSSSREALSDLTHRVQELNPEVGVVTTNTFSHYLYGLAWEDELEKPVTIRYFDPSLVSLVRPQYILISSGDLARFPVAVLTHYENRYSSGKWNWLAALPVVGKVAESRVP